MYYIYMLRCKDNTIYTGITTNLKRRMNEHFLKTKKCAKYTYSHTPEKIEAVWETEDRKNASKLEFNIKKLTKDKKENLINNNKKIEDYLLNKIDINMYKKII